MISFNSTHVVGGRVKLCLSHPKPEGIIVRGMWAIFWCNINTLFFCSQHTGTLGTWGHWGSPPCSWGYRLLGRFPVGVPVGQGPDVGGGLTCP